MNIPVLDVGFSLFSSVVVKVCLGISSLIPLLIFCVSDTKRVPALYTLGNLLKNASLSKSIAALEKAALNSGLLILDLVNKPNKLVGTSPGPTPLVLRFVNIFSTLISLLGNNLGVIILSQYAFLTLFSPVLYSLNILIVVLPTPNVAPGPPE